MIGYYYKITEAGEFIEKTRRGIAGEIPVYQFDIGKCPNGYWPIYIGRSNKFLKSAEVSKQYIENYMRERA